MLRNLHCFPPNWCREYTFWSPPLTSPASPSSSSSPPHPHQPSHLSSPSDSPALHRTDSNVYSAIKTQPIKGNGSAARHWRGGPSCRERRYKSLWCRPGSEDPDSWAAGLELSEFTGTPSQKRWWFMCVHCRPLGERALESALCFGKKWERSLSVSSIPSWSFALIKRHYSSAAVYTWATTCRWSSVFGFLGKLHTDDMLLYSFAIIPMMTLLFLIWCIGKRKHLTWDVDLHARLYSHSNRAIFGRLQLVLGVYSLVANQNKLL